MRLTALAKNVMKALYMGLPVKPQTSGTWSLPRMVAALRDVCNEISMNILQASFVHVASFAWFGC
jgi:hypothetical protein